MRLSARQWAAIGATAAALIAGYEGYRERSYDDGVGLHAWVPWEVKIPKTLIKYKDEIAGIEVVGRHRCHALWVQETLYGFVPIERVPL